MGVQGFQRWLNVGAVVAAAAGLSAIAVKNLPDERSYQIVNVSYDPTRELYDTINPQFVAAYEK
jgi:sulfate/thiosulfate transport system substrate-binding protein